MLPGTREAGVRYALGTVPWSTVGTYTGNGQAADGIQARHEQPREAVGRPEI